MRPPYPPLEHAGALLLPRMLRHTTKPGNIMGVPHTTACQPENQSNVTNMKKTLTATCLAAMTVTLTACGSPNAPAEFEKISHAENWINNAGYDCNEWRENSDTHALCRLDEGESITITLSDDPVGDLAWYFEEATWAGAAVGDNWFSVCSVTDMDKCGALSSGEGLNYIPNPIYVS